MFITEADDGGVKKERESMYCRLSLALSAREQRASGRDSDKIIDSGSNNSSLVLC